MDAPTLPSLVSLLFLFFLSSCNTPQQAIEAPADFDSERDLISLHYDHAPDQDDGHSAAADRTILQTEFGVEWIESHVIPVSGAYGENAASFIPGSDAVMDATWNDVGGWLDGHKEPLGARAELFRRWTETLRSGGDVWVKEGGQSDITADIVARIQDENPEIDTTARIHVVQHSTWNEEQTTDSSLAFTKGNTDYIRIADANAFLNTEGGNAQFVEAAVRHPVFGKAWRAAFDYYDPSVRLDFSDTGELLRILGLGDLGFDAFREEYLEN